MLILAPAAAGVLIYLLAWRHTLDARRALLVAATLWGTCLVGVTETLSLIEAVTWRGLLAAWSLACVAAVVAHLRASRRGVGWPPLPAWRRSPAAVLAL